MEQKLYDTASKLPETGLDFHTIQPRPKSKSRNRTWLAIASAAACFILLISIGFITVEAKEYRDAIKFFNEYGLSTDGLSRGEIKAVYRDITTKSFTYSKTAEVIANSLSSDQVGGYEILQDNPTPEDIENLWAFKNSSSGNALPTEERIHYTYHYEEKTTPEGIIFCDKSYINKYDGETLLWSVPISEFTFHEHSIVSDGVIVYGRSESYPGSPPAHAWMAKIDNTGTLLWKKMVDNDFDYEYIAAILENADGSYAVISRGDLKYFCLSQYTTDGTETHFKKTEVGNYGIWDTARLGDGYIVQLSSPMTNEYSKIIKVDYEGNITESFSYGGKDAYYYITDMIAYNGNIYLSAYCVPKLEDEDQSAGGRYEIAAVLNYLFDNGIWEISSEELTPMVRDNYTAMLLVCDQTTGTPQEFYSVKGSLGGELSLGDSGMLLWDVESITTTFFSPATSFFSIGGTSYVFRYTFDANGRLVSQEKTGEVVDYRR